MSEHLQSQVARLTRELNHVRRQLSEALALLRAAQAEVERLRQWQTDRLLKELTE